MAAAQELPEVEIVAVPGDIQVLDGGVPWIRTRVELDREWTRLGQMLFALQRDRGLEYDDLDGHARALIGMAGAASWTLGRQSTGPMTNTPSRATGASIRRARDTWCIRLSGLRLESDREECGEARRDMRAARDM